MDKIVNTKNGKVGVLGTKREAEEFAKLVGGKLEEEKYFKVSFTYDGSGEIIFDAKNKDEARELFLRGDWENEDVDDTSDNYVIEEINSVDGDEEEENYCAIHNFQDGICKTCGAVE